MKQMIHCCFTSHQEVMFRCPQDVGFFLNLLALTSWKYGIDIFADTEMSNHVHSGIGKNGTPISGKPESR